MFFKKNIEVRWSDIDANQHVTHTAYASFATHTRIEWMSTNGCSMRELLLLGFSAVLMKEQTEYFKEIFLGELVTVELYFAGESEDHTRWKFIHKLFNSKGQLAALYTVYGAWLDTKTRKITPPPEVMLKIILGLARNDEFEVLSLKEANN